LRFLLAALQADPLTSPLPADPFCSGPDAIRPPASIPRLITDAIRLHADRSRPPADAFGNAADGFRRPADAIRRYADCVGP
jgi:hypothetical protein